jgi:hypothetical protein
MANKTILNWTNPTQNTDNTAYNHQTGGKGYELALNSTEPQVVLPFAFGTQFDMKDLTGYQNLTSGSHVVRLRVVNKEDMPSAWASATFLKVGTPKAVADLVVA